MEQSAKSEGQDVLATDDDTVNVEEYPEVGRGTPAHLPQPGEHVEKRLCIICNMCCNLQGFLLHRMQRTRQVEGPWPCQLRKPFKGPRRR